MRSKERIENRVEIHRRALKKYRVCKRVIQSSLLAIVVLGVLFGLYAGGVAASQVEVDSFNLINLSRLIFIGLSYAVLGGGVGIGIAIAFYVILTDVYYDILSKELREIEILRKLEVILAERSEKADKAKQAAFVATYCRDLQPQTC